MRQQLRSSPAATPRSSSTRRRDRTVTTLDRRARNRALLDRQMLLRRSQRPVIEAVEALVGLQAQLPMNPYVGLWSRLGDFEPEVLSNLIAERAVVRVALMRSTIHLVSARDRLELRPLVQVVSQRGLQRGIRQASCRPRRPRRGARRARDPHRGASAGCGARMRLQALWPDYAPDVLAEPRAHTRGARAGATEGTLGEERGQRGHSCRHLGLAHRTEGPVTRRHGAALRRAHSARQRCKTHRRGRGLTKLGEVFDRLRPRLVDVSRRRRQDAPRPSRRPDRLAMSSRRRASSLTPQPPLVARRPQPHRRRRAPSGVHGQQLRDRHRADRWMGGCDMEGCRADQGEGDDGGDLAAAVQQDDARRGHGGRRATPEGGRSWLGRSRGPSHLRVSHVTPSALRASLTVARMSPGFTELDTAVGRCGIAWDDRAVTGVWLPGTRRLRESVEPPARVEMVIDAIVALLEGEGRDLSWVALDMEGIPDFDRRVYEVARTIPAGATASYGDVAARLGSPTQSRDVGRALARNPFAIVVPCHRVVGSRWGGGWLLGRGRRRHEGAIARNRRKPRSTDEPVRQCRPRLTARRRSARCVASDPVLGDLMKVVGPLGST